jgi:hypothetical protein
MTVYEYHFSGVQIASKLTQNMHPVLQVCMVQKFGIVPSQPWETVSLIPNLNQLKDASFIQAWINLWTDSLHKILEMHTPTNLKWFYDPLSTSEVILWYRITVYQICKVFSWTMAGGWGAATKIPKKIKVVTTVCKSWPNPISQFHCHILQAIVQKQKKVIKA